MDQEKAIQLIKEYVQYLIEKKHYVIKQAILFGSYAKGSYHEDSDIDIAIVLEDLGDSFDEQSPFAYEIIKTGIKIL